jgi:hypothetical protein
VSVNVPVCVPATSHLVSAWYQGIVAGPADGEALGVADGVRLGVCEGVAEGV